MFRKLFDESLLDENILDEELLMRWEETYRTVKDYCEKNDIAWDDNFDKYADKMYTIWEKLNKETTQELEVRYYNGKKYVSEHPKDINARLLLAGITTRLKNRGINPDMLKEKDTALTMDDVFDGFAVELDKQTEIE